MERISKMWRSGLALVLAICMVIGVIPATAFAAENEPLKYVSLGDSMTNGYGLDGYDGSAGVEDYGYGSYANQFAEAIGAEHAQLAMSALRAEDLHWLLELDYNDPEAIALTEAGPSQDGYANKHDGACNHTYCGSDYKQQWWKDIQGAKWNAKFSTGDYWTWNEICTHGRTKDVTDEIKKVVDASFYPDLYQGGYNGDVALIAKYFQESVKNADVVSVGIGNGNFGVFMFGRLMEAIGFDGTPSQALVYEVERALEECSPAIKAKLLSLKGQLEVAVKDAMADKFESSETLDALVNSVIYAGLSFALNYAGALEAVLELNSDADIILVELMNTFGDGTKEVEGITLGDLMDAAYGPLNAYIAGLPTVMKGIQNSQYTHGEIYYATADGVQCLVDTYGDDFYDAEGNLNPNSTIRDRFVESIVGYCDHSKNNKCTGDRLDSCSEWKNGMVWGLMGDMELVPGMKLCRIDYADILAYVAMSEAQKAAFAADNARKAMSIAVYLAFEDAVANVGKNGEPVTVEAVLGLGELDISLFSGVMKDFTDNIDTAAAQEVNNAAAGVVLIADAKGFTLTAEQVLKAKADPEYVYEIVAGLSQGLLNAAAVKALYVADYSDDAVYETVSAKTGLDAAVVKQLYLNNAHPDVVNGVNTLKNYKGTIMGGVDALKAAVDGMDSLCMLLAIPDVLSESLKTSESLSGLLALFSRCVVGNGLGGHPSQKGHDTLAASVIDAYGNYTAKDETEKHLKYVLGELKGFLEEYAPNVASQAYDLWIKNGYQEKVDECIAELIALLDARKANYTDVVLPALNDTIAALSAQKDALSAELTVLKAQLEAKKAELEAVLAEQTIPGVSAPDLSIDVELGNNQPTTVPGNDCAGAGYTADELAAAIADLEHAIAVTEALIADITADINDMIALAEEIAESVESLIKTLADIAAAAQALKEAVVAVANVLTDDSAKAATETFISAYNTAREAALTAADALGLLLETVKGDAAAIEAAAAVLENGTLELCQKLAGDKDELVDILINNISTDKLLIAAVSLDLIKTVLEENEDGIKAAIEAKKAELKAELEDALKALEAEYAPQIESKKAELEAKKAELEAKKAEVEAELKAEFEAKYAELTAKAEAEIAALEAAAAEKLAALEAELAAKQAELEALAEDAAEEVRAGIQAQIDRITGDIATINADLLCATEHVDAALKAAYDALVAEVTALYNQAVAELENAYNQAIAELENAYNNLVAEYEAAVKALKDAYNAAVKELEDAFNTTISGIIENVKGQVSAAIENVKQTLIDLGVNSVESLVNAITTLVQEILHQATHADLALGGTSTYVALGDGSAKAESYVEMLAEKLEAEYGIQGYTNYAAAGNTVASVKANLGSYADLADADLITVGFSNVTMLNNAIANALEETPVAYDWTKLVGKELAPYVEEALAEVYAEIAAIDLGAEITEMLNIAIEGIAYGALEYAIELPQLIAAIREVNADAVIVILGQYDPMDGAVLKFDDVSVDVSEYIGYFVDGVTAHGIAYCVLTGEAIFVEAPAVATANTDKELTFVDLMRLAKDDFASMYPSTTGDIYITNQILEALNISKIPVALWGDADSNGAITLRDAILILQAANGKDVALDRNASDVNGDGQITLEDAIRVLKRANGHTDLFPVEG